MARKYQKKFASIAKNISDYDLQKEPRDNLDFSEDDLLDLRIMRNEAKAVDHRFLGFFTKAGIDLVFDRFGIYKHLKKQGFSNILIHFNTADIYRQRFSFYYDKIDRDHLLGEMICRIYHLKMDGKDNLNLHGSPMRTLLIEWLSLQNPKKNFAKNRPRLPGQNHPGLGLGLQIFELLWLMSKRLHCDAILNIPDHYHNAVIYSKEFFYLNPVYEGMLQAILRDFGKKMPLAHISSAIDTGCVKIKETGETLEWFTGRQLTPLKKELLEYFSTDIYRQTVKSTFKNHHFEIDDN